MLQRKLLGLAWAAIITISSSSSIDDAVVDWNHQARAVMVANNVSVANNGTRLFAALHVAQWRAVLDTLQSRNLTCSGGGGAGADKAAGIADELEAAIASASREVLAGLVPSSNTSVSTFFDSKMGSKSGSPAVREGILRGVAQGKAVVADRVDDRAYVPAPSFMGFPNEAGKWRPTPPAFTPGSGPQWGQVKPWTLESASKYRLPPPPELKSDVYYRDYMQVKSLGNASSSERTQDQTDTANLFNINPEFRWFDVVEQVVNQSSSFSGWCAGVETARKFAFVSVVLADGRVALMDSKYTFNGWRPVTSIPLGNSVGFPADPAFTPLCTTPSSPDYISGHAGAAAMVSEALRVLSNGRDDFNITLTSEALRGKSITYTSLSQASNATALSRVYCGVHFWFSCYGQQRPLAASVAKEVLANFDAKISSLPAKGTRRRTTATTTTTLLRH